MGERLMGYGGWVIGDIRRVDVDCLDKESG